LVERVTGLENKVLDALRSRDADRVATLPPTGRLDSLVGRKYCVLVTYRKNGDAVPSPLWFGVAGRKVYAHTGGYKVTRLERNPAVRVAPCTFRGRPMAPPFAGTARVVPSEEVERAERAIQANYGRIRMLYYELFHQAELGHYIEVTPDP
jgi:hypothetical protein